MFIFLVDYCYVIGERRIIDLCDLEAIKGEVGFWGADVVGQVRDKRSGEHEGNNLD